MSDVIAKIDGALSRYYERFNRNDYFNADHHGKFKAFCEDNGMDTDDVLEELKQEWHECTLTEVDNDFPLKDDQKQDTDQAIYDIIRKCYDEDNAYAGSAQYDAIEVTKKDYTLLTSQETRKVMSSNKKETEKEEILQNMRYERLKSMTEPLSKSCNAVMSKAAQDQTFLQLLYIGQEKLNGAPYIHLVADLYARDRINYWLQIQPLLEKAFDENKYDIPMEKVLIPRLSQQDWAEMNKHAKIVGSWSKNKQELEILKHGITSYFSRLTPLMDMSTTYKINDNYEQICEYIANAVDFVHNLARNQEFQQGQLNAVCPFQYDFVIAFNDVDCCEKKVPACMDENNDSDDDDDIDEQKHISEQKDDEKYFDCFGNIKQRLKDSNCEYRLSEIDINDNTLVKLRFRPEFEEFKRQVKKKLVIAEKQRQQELNEATHKFNKIKKEYKELKETVKQLREKQNDLREKQNDLREKQKDLRVKQKDLSKIDQATLDKLEAEFNVNQATLNKSEAELNVFVKMEKRIEQLIAEECSDKDINEYPRRFRFISVLDRREPEKHKENEVIENDEFIFFEPTRTCFNFAKNNKCDNIKYFSNSKECIIPKDKKFDELKELNENNDYKGDKKTLAKELLQTQVINSIHSMKNGMLVLSFHVESVDEIRCYIYISGCMVRFLPDDLKTYLHEFFIDNDSNRAYWNDNKEDGHLNELIKTIKNKLIDKRFESFYEQYKLSMKAIEQDITTKIQKKIGSLKNDGVSIIDRIEEGLKAHYKQRHKPYFKIFSTYCDENNFTNADVVNELKKADNEENVMVYFDDSCPLDKAIVDDNEKAHEISKILKKIAFGR